MRWNYVLKLGFTLIIKKDSKNISAEHQRTFVLLILTSTVKDDRISLSSLKFGQNARRMLENIWKQ